MPSLGGDQHLITLGPQRAVLTEVGATLRAYEVDGQPIFWGFPEDEVAPNSRGQVLAPWPNRVEDGSYEFEGVEAEVPLDEPHRHNAIHGLVRWRSFQLLDRTDSAVRLETVLRPQRAYPFDLRLEVEYALVPNGIEIHSTATNIGWRPLPFGLGFHDYLAAGPGGADAFRVDLHAARRLLLDDRLLPVGEEDVVGTPYGVLRPGSGDPSPIGTLRLDDCFTGLDRDGRGIWRADVARGDGRYDTLRLWADSAFSWLMVFTGDSLEPSRRRQALAIEPMTCPPNALRTGVGLLAIEPGDSFSASWGLTLPGLD